MNEASNNSNILSYPLVCKGRFENPWSTWSRFNMVGVMKFWWQKNHHNIPTNEEVLNQSLPVLPINFSELTETNSGIKVVWFGHASVLFQFEGYTILADPVFSDYIGPQHMAIKKRYRRCPCAVEELPRVDAVVISHNHFDHLDVRTVYRLHEHFKDNIAWFVPMGLAQWMHKCGIKRVTELSWWDEVRLNDDGGLRIISTPAQHWSRRGPFDENQTLWCSWTIVGSKHSVFFCGDTGYCPAFKEIGQMYGPIDLAAIPIAPQEPRSFMAPQHIGPAEAVMVHKDIRARKTLGIHWGTFRIGKEFYMEPPKSFAEAAKSQDCDDECFVLKHGEVRTLFVDADS